ncbi:GNAT family N-acetyltransferase [Evansella tamaricis]|uniref:GNAT family N-acetyltransferase n=1 Tax=Evansella tamaricis TaxID=2069301 RepID=A0ABS6JNZ2_9BACI|nr:GNAT family protein [Evansella tamaricis]MBU9714023.1 GNAT family N-acetyltransferase [Evansella tamaricis]
MQQMGIGRDIPKIETERFVLRGIKVLDAPELFKFMSDKETMKYITPNPVKQVEAMEEFIEESMENFQQEKEIPWVIETKEMNQVIGMFRLHKLNLWHRKAEMGVVIRKEFQKRGVMTEVFRTIVPYGFEELGLNRIVGDIFAGNTGSKKLLLKFGFVQEGVLRQTDFDGKVFHDTIVFSMLRSEFALKKQLFM